MISTFTEDDACSQMKKDIRQKEAQFVKEKAILEQKVELLEIQLKDVHEREENFRKMHDTMISVFKAEAEQSIRTPREVELASRLHKKDMEEIKGEHGRQLQTLEQELLAKETEVEEAEHRARTAELQLERDRIAAEASQEKSARELAHLYQKVAFLEEAAEQR